MKSTMIDDRIYKVVACWRCPFHQFGSHRDCCIHPEEYQRHLIDIPKTFPDWCPLKDVDEGDPTTKPCPYCGDLMFKVTDPRRVVWFCTTCGETEVA